MLTNNTFLLTATTWETQPQEACRLACQVVFPVISPILEKKAVVALWWTNENIESQGRTWNLSFGVFPLGKCIIEPGGSLFDVSPVAPASAVPGHSVIL